MAVGHAGASVRAFHWAAWVGHRSLSGAGEDVQLSHSGSSQVACLGC